jgi:hypothetical protein
MALAAIPLPYGLRDVKVQKLLDDGTATTGSKIDLPYSRTFKFSEKEEFEDLRGDDALQASHGAGPNVEWELEAGGLSFEAMSAMYGGLVTTTGATPNLIKRWRKLITDTRPYFTCEGQSISDSGGDVHGKVYRCKATDDMSGEFGDGKFFLSGGKGTGFGNLIAGADLNVLFDFFQNETAVTIT